MLTAKQNMLETIRGGNPDRFVNNFEGLQILFHPFLLTNPQPGKGDPDVKNNWGVTMSFPAHVPGAFPLHSHDAIVVQDIENWKDYVKAPSLQFSDEVWAQAKAMYDNADDNLALKATFIAPGLFEQTHYLCEMSRALEYYITDPDEMKDMIKLLKDWSLEMAEGICKHLKPEVIFQHDDWGSEISTFLRPEMHAEFFLDAYKEIFGYYKKNGVEAIILHNDSYSATLVPYMIEMGIDVWQGPMASNNIPELIEKYGDQITFMGGLDNKFVDFTGWTQEDAKNAVRKTLDACGNKGFIPCITQGGPGSLFEGAYKALWDEVDAYNIEKFGVRQEDLDANRLPMVTMF